MDELGEFSSHVLEVLRQPMEDLSVTISRANRSLHFPAAFTLVAAMNPCPCGFLMSSVKTCQCSSLQVQKYLAKISGPLLDRIDIHLQVPSLRTNEILDSKLPETSIDIKKRTSACRQLQQERFKTTSIRTNAQMSGSYVQKYCGLDDEGKILLQKAMETLGLSARAYDKILKVARTVSDLEGCENILPRHIAEAISYRALDRIKQ